MMGKALSEELSYTQTGLFHQILHLGSFGDFRCGVLLFMVILVIYKYKSR